MIKNKLNNFATWLLDNIVLIFGIVLVLMNFIAFAAPLLAHLEINWFAGIVYKFYSYLCHQRPWRSIHFFDYKVAWCTRDVFIYISMTFSVFSVLKFRVKKSKWYWAVLSIFPFALDGTTQLIAEIVGITQGKEVFFYSSTNFMRMLTGTIFGAGAGIYLFNALQETVREDIREKLNLKNKKTQIKEINYFKLFTIILIVSFIIYLGIVQLWNITSDKYKPYGLIDHKRYYPGVNYEEVDRTGHGV